MNSQGDRQTATQEAYTELVRGPLYLDTETTGLSEQNEILEICILEVDGSVRFESLVKPRGPIASAAYGVHRITKRIVQDAPTWDHVAPQVQAVLAGRRVAIYNAAFDLRLLRQSHARYQLPWEWDEAAFFCVKKLYVRFRGRWNAARNDDRWLGLARAARECGIPHAKIHRAHAEAQLTRAVLQHMASHFVPPPVPVPVMPQQQSRLQRLLTWLFGE